MSIQTISLGPHITVVVQVGKRSTYDPCATGFNSLQVTGGGGGSSLSVLVIDQGCETTPVQNRHVEICSFALMDGTRVTVCSIPGSTPTMRCHDPYLNTTIFWLHMPNKFGFPISQGFVQLTMVDANFACRESAPVRVLTTQNYITFAGFMLSPLWLACSRNSEDGTVNIANAAKELGRPSAQLLRHMLNGIGAMGAEIEQVADLTITKNEALAFVHIMLNDVATCSASDLWTRLTEWTVNGNVSDNGEEVSLLEYIFSGADPVVKFNLLTGVASYEFGAEIKPTDEKEAETVSLKLVKTHSPMFDVLSTMHRLRIMRDEYNGKQVLLAGSSMSQPAHEYATELKRESKEHHMLLFVQLDHDIGTEFSGLELVKEVKSFLKARDIVADVGSPPELSQKYWVLDFSMIVALVGDNGARSRRCQAGPEAWKVIIHDLMSLIIRWRVASLPRETKTWASRVKGSPTGRITHAIVNQAKDHDEDEKVEEKNFIEGVTESKTQEPVEIPKVWRTADEISELIVEDEEEAFMRKYEEQQKLSAFTTPKAPSDEGIEHWLKKTKDLNKESNFDFDALAAKIRKSDAASEHGSESSNKSAKKKSSSTKKKTSNRAKRDAFAKLYTEKGRDFRRTAKGGILNKTCCQRVVEGPAAGTTVKYKFDVDKTNCTMHVSVEAGQKGTNTNFHDRPDYDRDNKDFHLFKLREVTCSGGRYLTEREVVVASSEFLTVLGYHTSTLNTNKTSHESYVDKWCLGLFKKYQHVFK